MYIYIYKVISSLKRKSTISIRKTAFWLANLRVSKPLTNLCFRFVAGTIDELDELTGGGFTRKGAVEPDGLAGDLVRLT